MGGHMGFGSFGVIGMILALVITVGVIIGVVLLVVWAVRRLSAGGAAGTAVHISGTPTAKEILQNRYASGELSREQYKEMLSDLE
jgi:putative membrane protein